ncbi:MAG TPA: hypothetical protein VHR66_01210 [Gemmataceae bacterium]|jgi:hypothetical protein|nr:hypothetical protein [Gemmataceae bacterium]
MKRTAAAFMLLAGLGGGCMTTDHKADSASAKYPASSATEAIQYRGPHGEPITPATVRGQAPSGISRADGRDMGAGGIVPVTGYGDRVGREATGGYLPTRGNVPTGTDGVPAFYPGRGIMPVPPMGPYGAVAAVGAMPPGGLMAPINARTSVRFGDPERMKITWMGAEATLTTPARYNFPQGGIYRLKLSNIPGRGDVDLYPTLEIVPATAKTAAYLAHSSVPVSFTDEDFEQVIAGNFLVKVIYLPDPAFQDLAAVAGPAELISTRLEAGVDPIAEARRRGEILAIVRLGNIDLEVKGSPGLGAPNPFAGPVGMPPMGPPPGGPGAGTGPAPKPMPPVKLPE